MLVIAASATASQELQRPRAASPEDSLQMISPSRTGLLLETPIYKDRSILSDAFQDGGDRLTAMQQNDGGWTALNDGNPANASPVNTIGPIGKGLAGPGLAARTLTITRSERRRWLVADQDLQFLSF